MVSDCKYLGVHWALGIKSQRGQVLAVRRSRRQVTVAVSFDLRELVILGAVFNGA